MQCASFQWRDIDGHNWRTIWPILFKMCTLTKHPPEPSAALILQSSLLRRELFGTLFNVVETWQKSVCQLVIGVNFAAFIGHWKLKRLSASGGLRPPDRLTPWPGALSLDPRYRLALPRSPCADPLAMGSVLGSLNLKLGPADNGMKIC